MNLTDFYFLCAYAVILVIYYTVPKRFQWGVLLVSSIAYYLANGHPGLILCPFASIFISYTAARRISDTEDKGQRKRILVLSVILLLISLISFKYIKYIIESVMGITLGWHGRFGIFGTFGEIIIPLGLSYYTFTLIGYVTDVYNGLIPAQSSFFRFAAFGMYFPVMVSGPIMQYRELGEGFLKPHDFEFNRIIRGFQRILWGFFKKLVVAERLNETVTVLFADSRTFQGLDVFLAILLFTIQLYSDFSGLMDIVLGVSETFGIDLPENFRAPFLAPTISEYWRRWHITLGVWFREYVFYPVLRTKLFSGLQSRAKARFGKKAGKRISTFIAMFVLWFTVGLWHGGNPTFIIGSGLLHWLYIVLEEMTHDPFMKLWDRLHIDPEAGWLKCIRVIRTFILVNIGNAFFRSKSVADAFKMFRYGFKSRDSILPMIIGDLMAALQERGIRAVSDVTMLGSNYIDLTIALFGIIFMLVISIISIRTGTDMRDRIAKWPLAVRCIVWFCFIFMLLLIARYGPEYSSAEFIYQGF